ncbi:MAG: hypothetical protein NC206_09455, partial [Bacteroides sp.]|nr:hypothetical protein [Roseburia sp.]MCM1347295.1 hypothetical protein [Bacteroides sp.]MCM1421768.1 hypothetical protein [Bacteroides sp.]
VAGSMCFYASKKCVQRLANLGEEPDFRACKEFNYLIDKVYSSSPKLGEVSLCNGGVRQNTQKAYLQKVKYSV